VLEPLAAPVASAIEPNLPADAGVCLQHSGRGPAEFTGLDTKAPTFSCTMSTVRPLRQVDRDAVLPAFRESTSLANGFLPVTGELPGKQLAMSHQYARISRSMLRAGIASSVK
jgi:hypothetical protein